MPGSGRANTRARAADPQLCRRRGPDRHEDPAPGCLDETRGDELVEILRHAREHTPEREQSERDEVGTGVDETGAAG